MYRGSQVYTYLYEDEEFNFRPEVEHGKTASEYKQFYCSQILVVYSDAVLRGCLSTYDTLSEKGKIKREFVCRGAEVKLRIIVLRTRTCGVISYLYRNKLDVARGGGQGVGGEGPGRRSRGGGLPGVQGWSQFLQGKSAFSAYFR